MYDNGAPKIRATDYNKVKAIIFLNLMGKLALSIQK